VERDFEVFPAVLVVGVSFSLTQYFWSNHVDSNCGHRRGIVSLLATVIFLRFWKPKHIYLRARARGCPERRPATSRRSQVHRRPGAEGLDAVRDPVDLRAAVGLPAIRAHEPGHDTRVARPSAAQRGDSRGPGRAESHTEAARYDFNWLSATGTGCFVAAIVAGLLLGVRPAQLAKIFWNNLKRMKTAVIAISFMLAWGIPRATRGSMPCSGCVHPTGWLFPSSHLPGVAGVALTGSDTSSNALFAACSASRRNSSTSTPS